MNNLTPGEAERLAALVRFFDWQGTPAVPTVTQLPEAQALALTIFLNCMSSNVSPVVSIATAMEVGFRLGRSFENSEALERAFNPEAVNG